MYASTESGPTPPQCHGVGTDARSVGPEGVCPTTPILAWRLEAMAGSMGDVDLLFPFMSGITAPKDFRLGVELEYFLVYLSDLSLVPYDATLGIRDILS